MELQIVTWDNVVATSVGSVKASTYDFNAMVEHHGIQREHHGYEHDIVSGRSCMTTEVEIEAITKRIGARYSDLFVFSREAAVDLSDIGDAWMRKYPTADVITAQVTSSFCEVTWIAVGFNNKADAMVFKLAEF